MAALCGGVVGSSFCRNHQLFRLLHKSFIGRLGCNHVAAQHTAPSETGSAQEIIIPRKKKWNEEAVLQALASTVNRDPTASHYRFQDDAFLTPKTSSEFKLFSQSQEAGKNAAEYVVNTYPKYFTKDYAEPHVPCLMPDTLKPQVSDVSEGALKELIQLRKVRQAVSMYDQLLQAGTAVSLEMTNDLLDLICFYGDQDPQQEETPDQEKSEDGEEQELPPKSRRGRSRKLEVWRKDNNAERIFNLMAERSERSYSALIRGMVKYGAQLKAFDLYADMLNNRMSVDVNTFNALIIAAPEVRQKYNEKWELIVEILKQMKEQGMRPSLLTFNAVLKSSRRCGPAGRMQALQTLSEMKAVGIEPSLASYNHILAAFYRTVFGPSASFSNVSSDILHKVMDEVSGKSFIARDPDDVHFFNYGMKICCSLKDLGLAYRLHQLLGVGDNWRFLGSPSQEAHYYGRFFHLICMMETVDTVLLWYRDLVPSLFYPNSGAMRDVLQALDTDNRLDLIPEIWKDIKRLGLSNKAGDLVEEVLSLMARDKHSPEVHESFAECALEVKATYGSGEQGQVTLDWTASALGNIASILLAAGRTKQAWDMLPLFKANNRVPAEKLLDDFLSSAMLRGDPQRAVTLVQLSASFSLPATARLAQRVQQECELNEEHKTLLVELEALSHDKD
ncbi:small ribosomal subunit protein mS39 [Paramormyrops kingsleyae]|uniref:Small ribosomal subunit protein mS39 n=1 Tax=Paramormyrops kingsleyae TaxID=1676925 RepID=A0A3B3RRB1_9TELE|nr:pentatricopeptide repeat domain-containing protein 3, mitochondrial [Paramormyrops kingsleyae]